LAEWCLKFYLFLINASSLYTTGYALTREEARTAVSNLGYSDLKSEGWNQSFYKYIHEQLLTHSQMALQVPTKAFLHGHAFSTLQVSSPTSPILSANTEPIPQ